MATTAKTTLPDIVIRSESEILPEWMRHQLGAITMRRDLIDENDLREQSTRFLRQFVSALKKSEGANIQDEEWAPVRELLTEISTTRARQGFTPSETATFVFSLKQPLFERLRRELSSDPAQFADETWRTTVLLDKLGIFTTELYQRGREELIQRQQQEMLELSTPVVQLWNGVLALPLIGTLDSQRTQIVME